MTNHHAPEPRRMYNNVIDDGRCGRRGFVLATLGLLAGCGGAKAGPSATDSRSALVPIAPFDLRSSVWMNLHHVLYALVARGEQVVEAGAELTRAVEALPESERRVMHDAARAYESYAERDLLFDDALGSVTPSLATTEDDARPALEPAVEALGSALVSAVDVYRARFWSSHDEQNRRWIERARPLLEAHGAAISARLSKLYGGSWKPEHIRADVTLVANWSGAYTSLGPVHITIASGDRRNQDAYALEILFHEASHAMIRVVRDAIAAEARRQSVEEPKNLWHALLFYTSGMAVKERLPEHVLYADREGLFSGPWAKYRPALAEAWQRYLDGASSFEGALAATIAAAAR
ncbi:MAG: hypothetical protein U0271_38195 [Polyangiaceae bacterium]